ncbi:MAG: RusA family crossover junction endodeoxyribonuclease [Lactobacillaceae bacterium]|jgi:Holliday junction resolvase RusA-like endonuclease|nr:RusA family crossover junction endodeoxyribonuclease [Lactobacillaceae bacterium]
MKKIFEAKIELPMKFSSGNQHGQNGTRFFRPEKYHAYQDYLINAIQDVMNETHPRLEDGSAYFMRLMFIYPVPKAFISSKAKQRAFDSSKLLPITRGTIDLDNSSKGTIDAMQVALGFDDSQIVSEELHKRYYIGKTHWLKFELYEMPSGQKIEFYD